MKINKFFMGGALILAGVVYLIASSTQANAEYFMTVDELIADGDNAYGKSLRLSGAVIGDTVQYDPETLTLTFEIAHVTGDNKEIERQGGLALVLFQAVNDPTRQRVKIQYVGPKPDLLRSEAQAIVTGKLNEDGVFIAEELLLKCPTRYDEAVPEQAASN
ncbi:MAG: cytochrome c maturation protein CcmE [Chloroflexi bacterium]|nr:cytochrome c maturation protein CcmE [Chloroflexota bacterium]